MTETAKTSRQRRRRWISLAIGLILLAGAGVGLVSLSASRANGANDAAQGEDSAESAEAKTANEKGEGEEDKKEPVPVEVTSVVRGTVSSYITATANLVAENQVKVLAEVEGRVLELMVEEGDPVRKGQSLAVLVRDDQEILLKKAELKESEARLAFDRARDLVAKELISREEFDKLSIEFEIARQELAEARWSFDKTTIRAPFGGRVTDRLVQTGQHVRPGDELFEVTDFEPLIARIFLPERDVLDLDTGRSVRIRLNADESVVFPGRIRQISPVVDTATGTVKVTIEASSVPAAVRPGSFVGIGIVRQTRTATLLLPREAVLRELQKAHVFVALDGVAKRRRVELGLEEGEVIEALTGVEEGERVIVAGQGGLKDGSPVKLMDGDLAG